MQAAERTPTALNYRYMHAPELSFLAQTATLESEKLSIRTICERDAVLGKSRPEIVPLHSQSPQPFSITGHAKEHQAKGIKMRITRSIRSPLFALVLLAMSAAAYAQLSVSVSFAPPELPVYEQPLCPGDGYLWTPGYWAYADDDYGYYWVPGTWVMAPEAGLLWTPAYWGWGNNGYVFNQGYWGQQVGFYGGVSYGYGYNGDGYQGGRWQGRQFYYNRSVSNVNVTNIHNVYNTTVINNTTVNRVSYNGGNGGISARPTAQQESVAREKHVAPVAAQTQHAQAARTDPEQRASVNHGTPAVAATPKPGAFTDRAAVHAKPTGTPYVAPVRAAAQPPANTPHPAKNAAPTDRPQPKNQPEPNKAEPNKAEPNKPEPSKAEPNKAEPNKPEPNKPEPNKPEPNKAEPNKAEPSKPEPNKPEPNKPEPNKSPAPNRSEPTQRPLTPPPSAHQQPEHTASPSEPQPVAKQPQHPQSAPNKPEEKKPQEEKPKDNEKPQ
jgi:hypothetical protein